MSIRIRNSYLNTENLKQIRPRTITQNLIQDNPFHLWGERKKKHVDTVVIHYISAFGIRPDTPFAINIIFELFYFYKVSSHYLITRDGTVYGLVPEEKKAWHCGGSIMPEPDSRQMVNEFSLGIELVATKDSGFTDLQYKSLVDLCDMIEKRWPISFYLGHQDIAGKRAVELGLRNDIKDDPGALFDWDLFKQLRTQLKA